LYSTSKRAILVPTRSGKFARFSPPKRRCRGRLALSNITAAGTVRSIEFCPSGGYIVAQTTARAGSKRDEVLTTGSLPAGITEILRGDFVAIDSEGRSPPVVIPLPGNKKGEIRRALHLESAARRELEGTDTTQSGAWDEREGFSNLEKLQCEAPLPDKVVELNRVRSVAFERSPLLSEVEQKIICGVYVYDMSVDDVADYLGYSRGHAYAIRKTAERKVRSFFREKSDRALNAA
jgi:hypothetical protein